MCTHSRGSTWKSSFERAPWLVTKVMDNGTCVWCITVYIHCVTTGFYTPLGILVILGLHVLPLGLYIVQYPPFELMLDKYHLLVHTGIAILAFGRFVCALVEVSILCAIIVHSI